VVLLAIASLLWCRCAPLGGAVALAQTNDGYWWIARGGGL
jgi:hypothetical protein